MKSQSFSPTFSKRDITVLTTLMLLSSANAHAYLDPGTGTMILQGIVAAIVSGFMAIKMGWFRIKSVLPGQKNNTNTEENPTEKTDKT